MNFFSPGYRTCSYLADMCYYSYIGVCTGKDISIHRFYDPIDLFKKRIRNEIDDDLDIIRTL